MRERMGTKLGANTLPMVNAVHLPVLPAALWRVGERATPLRGPTMEPKTCLLAVESTDGLPPDLR